MHDCALVVTEDHQYELNLTEAPQNSTVAVGHNVSFHCRMLFGHPYVRWFKGNLTAHGKIGVCESSQFLYRMPNG